jgi:hypothetical protein
MAGSNRNWRADLIARYRAIFPPGLAQQAQPPDWPEVGDGWEDLLLRACERVAAAGDGHPGVPAVTQIMTKYGTLRLHVRTAGLGAEARVAVENAVALAEARSACTCEVCGATGRLYEHDTVLSTACDEHARGDAVEIRPGWENIHIIHRLHDGHFRILSCRRYDRDSDSFDDVPPLALGIKE